MDPGELAMSGDMKQHDLLDDQPIARNTDPVTSHQAAAELTQSGTRAAQQHAVLEAVKKFPLRTSAEIAEAAGIDRYAAARRLPELRNSGLVRNGTESRRCGVTGKRAMVWFVPVGGVESSE